MRRACTVAVLLWVLLSVGLFIATAVHGATSPSLTPAQVQFKADAVLALAKECEDSPSFAERGMGRLVRAAATGDGNG